MPDKQRSSQTEEKQQVFFIRHGESEAHIGKAATHIEVVGLTSSGKELARKIASEFTHAPDLIIVSPYLRAWETAGPTMKRFPAVPHAIWKDVREFTYLGSLAGQCLTKQERSVWVEKFWGDRNPHARDGNGESFAEFVGRARRTLTKLWKELEEKDFIVVFTHEQFIRAMQFLLLEWQEDAENDPAQMVRFRRMLLDYPLDYGYKDDESWHRYLAQQRACRQVKADKDLADLAAGLSADIPDFSWPEVERGLSVSRHV